LSKGTMSIAVFEDNTGALVVKPLVEVTKSELTWLYEVCKTGSNPLIVTAIPNIMISVTLNRNDLPSVPLNRLGLSFETVQRLSSVSQEIVERLSSMLDYKVHFDRSWFEYANQVLTPQSFENLILSWLMNGFDGNTLKFVLRSSSIRDGQIEKIKIADEVEALRPLNNEYVQTGMREVLLSSILKCIQEFRNGKLFAPYVTLVQSSGFGKRKLLYELADSDTAVVYFNCRTVAGRSESSIMPRFRNIVHKCSSNTHGHVPLIFPSLLVENFQKSV